MKTINLKNLKTLTKRCNSYLTEDFNTYLFSVVAVNYDKRTCAVVKSIADGYLYCDFSDEFSIKIFSDEIKEMTFVEVEQFFNVSINFNVNLDKLL